MIPQSIALTIIPWEHPNEKLDIPTYPYKKEGTNTEGSTIYNYYETHLLTVKLLGK